MCSPRPTRWLLLLLCLALASCDTMESVPDDLPARPSPSADAPAVPLRVQRQGDVSLSKANASGMYASTVVSAVQGGTVPTGTVLPERSDPAQALGAPDDRFFSLGFDDTKTEQVEGVLVVSFDQGLLFNGLTLTVYEETYGKYLLEQADVYVSASVEDAWQYVGTARSDGSVTNTRPTSFDVMGRCVRFVRIVNTTDPSPFSARRKGDGFDVNAVGIDGSGTCATSFGVSGTVYADADEDDVKDASESGLTDVVVSLTNGTSTYQATTGADGSYTIDAPAGEYTLTVPSSAPGAFNALLYDTHGSNSGTPAQRTVVVGPTPASADFGFVLDIDKLVEALESGDIPTKTKTSQFWARQAQYACLPNGAAPEITPTVLDEYLTEVESLLLAVPFQFGSDNECVLASCAAYTILNPTSDSDVALFLRELLTAELNVVSGNGADSAALNQAILAFAEAVAAEQIYGPGGASSSKAAAATLQEALTLLRAFNSSGGGGGVGGEQ